MGGDAGCVQAFKQANLSPTHCPVYHEDAGYQCVQDSDIMDCTAWNAGMAGGTMPDSCDEMCTEA